MNIDQTKLDQACPEEQRALAPSIAPADNEITPVTQIEVERVVDLLIDRRSRLRRGALYWIWMLLSPLCGLILLAGLANREPITVGLCLMALTAIYTMHRQADQLQEARTALKHAYLGPEWVGVLCEALEWPDRRVQNEAALLLTLMLPRFAANGCAPLSPEEATCLYRRLRRRAVAANPALAVVILEALPTLGTAEALPFVRRLTVMPAFGGAQRRVRAAARAALLALEQRIAHG
jgi:uncharacterized membrane protein YphA (DoxX/SURF4 family)